jgi:hypothetical protein
MVDRAVRDRGSRLVPLDRTEDPVDNERRFRAELERLLAEMQRRLDAHELRLNVVEEAP